MSRHKEQDGWEETRFEVRSRDNPLTLDEYRRQPRFPVSLILDNLRSAFNVGSIFRTADTARIAQVITCGYTAHPPHPRLEKTALGTLEYVETHHCSNAVEAVDDFRERGTAVWALETTSASVPYTSVEFPRPVVLVLGNEALGVGEDVLAACDKLVEIPVFGFKNSLNVASAAAVVLFEILRQWGAEP